MTQIYQVVVLEQKSSLQKNKKYHLAILFMKNAYLTSKCIWIVTLQYSYSFLHILTTLNVTNQHSVNKKDLYSIVDLNGIIA